jgi:ribosomal protein L23
MDAYKIMKQPSTADSAMKKIVDNSSLVFIVHPLFNKHQIRSSVKKLYDFDMAKVNTLNRHGTGCSKESVYSDWRQTIFFYSKFINSFN